MSNSIHLKLYMVSYGQPSIWWHHRLDHMSFTEAPLILNHPMNPMKKISSSVAHMPISNSHNVLLLLQG